MKPETMDKTLPGWIRALIERYQEELEETVSGQSIRKQKYFARDCYNIYIELRELDNPHYKDWLRKMVVHYLNDKGAFLWNDFCVSILIFDDLLEAALVLEDERLLDHVGRWGSNPYIERKPDKGKKRMMLEAAIIQRDTKRAENSLEEYKKSGKDSGVGANLNEVYDALISREKRKFDAEIEIMKARWKRSREWEKNEFKYFSEEIVFQSLFERYSQK